MRGMGDRHKPNLFYLGILIIGILCPPLGIAAVLGDPCDVKEVNNCYEDLVNYESIVFPLYGSDSAGLDDTCGNINASYSCIRSYASSCHSSPDCQEECQELVRDIRLFISNSGLERLSEDLCPEESPLRKTYLENVDCLERNADAYASCHNDSQKSLQYLSTLLPHNNAIEARCCYSRWYDQCFTNITQDNCNENATMFVSYASHKLVGPMIQILCAKTEIYCDRPPLPPEEGEEGGYDPDHTGDEMDKDKPDQTDNEIDNEINDEMKKKSMSAGTLHQSLSSVIILAYFYAVLCKYIL